MTIKIEYWNLKERLQAFCLEVMTTYYNYDNLINKDLVRSPGKSGCVNM